ncbi:MAG TPA: MarR family transcriptional regulator [Actinospica sp.]|jgi:DNA-binding MarR family transcriptional regulator|nr:MarR family transcriptional regulator [Actinospica sp.]
MSNDHGLAATEKAMSAHIGKLELDFPAAIAVSSLYRAANAVRNHLTNTVLREHDLSWTGFVVLWVVWIFDGLETRHAAQSAAISKGTLTGVAKTLEARGWLRRETDPADRRLVQLSLTAEGVALMEELYPKFNAAEAEVVARISPDHLPTLTEHLRTMVSTVEEMEWDGGNRD